MKIELEGKEYNLSAAQRQVVQELYEFENGKVCESPYYNYQEVDVDGLSQFYFKRPTKDWLKSRNILIPTYQNWLILNPKVKVL